MNYSSKSEKDFVATVLLCFFLGALGIHRFYVGKTGTGIIQLLTLGGS
jgi:TM2 domain-containing membrane protein YozV